MDDYGVIGDFFSPPTPDPALLEIQEFHRLLAEKIRIPTWILLGYNSKEELLLLQLTMTDEEIKATAPTRSVGAYFRHSGI
jgi:hypothetical protein